MNNDGIRQKFPIVAPFTGAWIETNLRVSAFAELPPSHPSRVRGLKPFGGITVNEIGASHPSRVRGLKQNGFKVISELNPSHPSRVRGLKLLLSSCMHLVDGRTLHGCVD